MTDFKGGLTDAQIANPAPNRRYTDDERREWQQSLRQLQHNMAFKELLVQLRQEAYAALVQAPPDHLTSVRLHAMLRVAEELPNRINSILNGFEFEGKSHKGNHNE